MKPDHVHQLGQLAVALLLGHAAEGVLQPGGLRHLETADRRVGAECGAPVVGEAFLLIRSGKDPGQHSGTWLALATAIVDEELASELNRRFGRPTFPVKVPKTGYGAGFAFGIPGRVKATGFTAAERDRIEAQMGKTIADLELAANTLLEYWLLATPRSLRDRIPGFEPFWTRQAAAAELAEIQIMVDTLHGGKEIATRPMDGVTARQLCRDIFGNFTRALASAGFVTNLPLRTRAELTGLLEHLPTQRVATSLKYHYVKQATTTWKISHLRDIEALSVAIPYTDAVVTDADVAGVATQRAGLDAEFGTPVFKNLTELATYLGL